MKQKILGLLCLSILTLVLFMGLGSATFNVDPTSLTFNKFDTSPQIFTIENNNSTSPVNISLTQAIINDSNGKKVKITFNETSQFNISASGTRDIEANVSFIDDDFMLGTYSTNYIIKQDGNSLNNVTLTLSFENSVCEYNNLDNNLDIKIDISVEEGFGDDEEWYPFDEIEVEIEVENNGPDDIDDIVVEWGLYNLETGEWVIDDEENDFNLKDGDEEVLIITFQLDDLDEFEDNGEYVFYAWATGEDDEFGGNKTCTSDSEGIEVVIENDFVILDDIEFSEVVQCGAEVQILADVWNIGDDDQDDVYVIIYNKELGINEKVEIGDIDAFDNGKLDTIIEIPKDAGEKYYPLTFWVYDEDDDIYENNNDDEAEFVIPLQVEGNCVVEPQVMVTASLESGGKAGQELVVRATITNTGDELATYNLNVEGYTDWASSAELDQNTVILDAGNSKDVLITLDVNGDVLGDKMFNIEVLSGDELIVAQPVSVFIEKPGFSFPGITGKIISRDNLHLWGIGFLNVILILAIIFVVVRVMKKKD